MQAGCVAMQASSDQLPTSFLLRETMAESQWYWAEHSSDEEKRRAILQNTRELLFRLRQKRCAFAHDRLKLPICSSDERLENMGCAHPEADEGEGPDIISAASFILSRLGVVTEEERLAIATVVVEGRNVLQDLDYDALKGRKTLPMLQDGQSEVILRKEAVRKEILRKIGEFLEKSA